MTAVLSQVVRHITQQVRSPEAQRELSDLGPASTDWNAMVQSAVATLVPRLVAVAPRLVERLHLVFRGPIELQNLLASRAVAEAFDAAQECDTGVRNVLANFHQQCVRYVDGAVELVSKYLVAQQVTKVIEDFLPTPEGLGDRVCINGNSMYPDLYLRERIRVYAALPQQRVRRGAIHGPCRNSRNQPSKVPDGLEVKTKRGDAIRVDCHAPNAGLHMVITWSTDNRILRINDVSLAYIRAADYSECARNTDATTVKFSFGQDPFISLLNGST